MKNVLRRLLIGGFVFSMLFIGTHGYPVALVAWKVVTVIAVLVVPIAASSERIQRHALEDNGADMIPGGSWLEYVFLVSVSFAVVFWLGSGLWLSLAMIEGLFRIVHARNVEKLAKKEGLR